MANLSVKLWAALQQLQEDEFKKFKWFLKQEDISVAQLERADRQDTVDLMAQKYGSTGAMKETLKVLEKISRNDLVQSLQNPCQNPKDLKSQDDERNKTEVKGVQQFAVEVTLDPDTAHPNPILSGNGKQVHCGTLRTKLLDNPEQFYRCVCWIGQRTNQQDVTNHTKS